MTFSISFPRVLSKMIGLKDLGKSYDDLFGLGIITIDNLLKWFGQYFKSIQAFAIFMTLAMQTLSFRWSWDDSMTAYLVQKLMNYYNFLTQSWILPLRIASKQILVYFWFCQGYWYRPGDGEQCWKRSGGCFTSYWARDMVGCHAWLLL